jgi:hypothetical protein
MVYPYVCTYVQVEESKVAALEAAQEVAKAPEHKAKAVKVCLLGLRQSMCRQKHA